MEDILQTVLNKMSNFKKPQKTFIRLLIATLSSFQGKANFRNLSRYCAMSEKRFSRWYRKAFDFTTLNFIMLSQITGKHTELIAAIDASFLSKAGKHIEGLARFFNGILGKCQRGLELSLISIVDIKANTAFSINARQTIDIKGKSRCDLYASQVTDIATRLRNLGIKYLTCDAWYYKVNFIDPVCKTGLHVISKLRCDANLYWLFSGSQPKKRGRPRKYAGKVKFDNLSAFTLIDIQEDTHIYSNIVYCKLLERNIRLVMLKQRKGKKVLTAMLFSTDTQLNPMQIVAYYKARFQIEFLFRDAKQHVGLADCQSRKKESINTHINASLTALNLIKLEDRKIKKTNRPTVISVASYKRKKLNKNLISLIFSKLGFCINDKKYQPILNEISNYGVIGF